MQSWSMTYSTSPQRRQWKVGSEWAGITALFQSLVHSKQAKLPCRVLRTNRISIGSGSESGRLRIRGTYYHESNARNLRAPLDVSLIYTVSMAETYQGYTICILITSSKEEENHGERTFTHRISSTPRASSWISCEMSGLPIKKYGGYVTKNRTEKECAL